MYKIHNANILEWANSYDGLPFHAVLCDPPYHLTSIVKRFGKDGSAPAKFGTDGVFSRSSAGFMGQQWDGGDVAFRPETWYAISKCLYPGAYLLAFGGTRTWHRLACAIEDAGFDIRDTVAWVYGQGFPKSHNISKALDKKAGAERTKVISTRHRNVKPYDDENGWNQNDTKGDYEYKEPATEEAKIWDGYGTALKPSFEPIILAQKPVEKTIAENCKKYGSGGLNIDGCRIDGESFAINKLEQWSGFGEMQRPDYTQDVNDKGRWPANLIHDGSEEVLVKFPTTKSGEAGVRRKTLDSNIYGNGKGLGFNPDGELEIGYGDNGSAARFFYCAKVSKEERELGCDLIDEKKFAQSNQGKAEIKRGSSDHQEDHITFGVNNIKMVHNNHPTLKPIALAEYLARLVLPPEAYSPRRILVPFSGAGSEIIGAHRAGWEEIIGVELTEEYCKITENRLKYWTAIPVQKRFFE